MVKNINFEDNIFILTEVIRNIHDSLILDAVPELFIKKIIADLDFVDQTLDSLLQRLLENTHLIDRYEQLDNFSTIERDFSQILESFTEGSGALSIVSFPEFREHALVLQNNSSTRRHKIDLSNAIKDTDHEDPLVSSAEYTELLKPLL
ncbi:hypothetical protein FACS1894164_07580 [Spirochaetia bacterium]|nr:hypothetical protein FACS1894164_07580 [Spirochaetia bacterium]